MYRHGLNLINEAERLHGSPFGENEGALILDLSVHYPYFGVENVSIDFEVSTSADNAPNSELKKHEVVSNHRYPNKTYVTLSEKSGRKTGKHGYAIVAPIEELNKIKYLTVSWLDSCITNKFILPVCLQLTKENPFGGLNFRILTSGAKDNVVVRTYLPMETGGWQESLYTSSKEALSQYTSRYENASLIIINKDTGMIEQIVTIPACNKKKVMV